MQLGYLQHILAGKAVPFVRPGTSSAIHKSLLNRPGVVTPLGLAGDEQGDLRIHGGVDKAIHHYPHEHYPRWRALLGDEPLLERPGAFGENLSSRGMTEANLCLGDVVSCGGVLLQVSQTRQPCWKLNERFKAPNMASNMQRLGLTGWYYRVKEAGVLAPGDAFVLQERPHPDWTLQRVLQVLYENTLDIESLVSLSRLPLVPSWERLVQRRLSLRVVEDWGSRINGPITE